MSEIESGWFGRAQELEAQMELIKKQVEILSKTNFDKVKEMHRAFGVKDPEVPDLRDPEVRELRAKLIYEETKELLHELGFRIGILWGENSVGLEWEKNHDLSMGLQKIKVKFDPQKIAKESADAKVVIYGTDAALGIDADVAFEAVHQSNMSKIGPDGKVIKREDGKVLKGEHYQPPDMSVIYSVVKTR